jgi:acetamidase/formamidase
VLGRWTRRLFGRGAGEGLGVHICTGPVAVAGAEPGDVLEVRILDVRPRPSAGFKGKSFGSNAAAWWGFHFNELDQEPKNREVITIYEVDATSERDWARAIYNFRWTPQTDPFGVVHKTIDYPGVIGRPLHDEGEPRRAEERARADPAALRRDRAWRRRKPTWSIPFRPAYTGGNIDNWRIGKGATMYYPVAVDGRTVFGRRPARGAGRFRTVRHGDRMLAHRHVPADPAQEGRPRRHRRWKSSPTRCSRRRRST